MSKSSTLTRLSRLHLLGRVLCTHAVNASSLEELDLGIEFLHSAIIYCDYSTARLLDTGVLADLASALHARWHLNEQLDNLNSSIRLRRLILSESSTSETQMSSISALSTSLFLRFTHFPRIVDLNEVVELDKRALALSPDGTATRLGSLCTLAQSLLVLSDYDGDMARIDTVITLLREAVSIEPPIANTLDYALALNALSEAIQSTYYLSDNDINECLTLDSLALTFVPEGHRERPLALAALATTVLVRCTISYSDANFALYQALTDELQAILDGGYRDQGISSDYWAFTQNSDPFSAYRPALTSIFRQRVYIVRAEKQPIQASPSAHMIRSVAPDVYLRRFIHSGDDWIVSLMIAFINLQRVETEDQRMTIRGDMAWLCRGRGDVSELSIPWSGSIQDVEKELLGFMPVDDDHPWASAFYCGVAENLLRVEDPNYWHKVETLERARMYMLRALDLLHRTHVSWRYRVLEDIASTYLLQATTECDNSEDGTTSQEVLDNAIHYSEQALATCPPYRRDDMSLCNVTSRLGRHRLYPQPDSSDLITAFQICRHICTDPNGSAAERFNFAEKLVEIGEEFGVDLLGAFITHIDTYYEAACTEFNMPSLVEYLSRSHISDALSRAVDHCFNVGEHEAALYMLDRGRGLLWTWMTQLQPRTFKETPSSSNDVAQLNLALEAAEDVRRNGGWGESPNIYAIQERMNYDIRRLMDRIPDRPRLRAIDSQPFMQTVSQGVFPIVVLFAGNERCDALVISGPSYAIQHIPLPECDRNVLDRLVEQMKGALKDAGFVYRSARYALRVNESWDTAEDSFEEVLADTWRAIVQPVIKALNIKPSASPPRLWWHPTGPFWQLPLHAAGVYNLEEDGVPVVSVLDYIVSSYLPPFSMSLPQPQDVKAKPPHILAVYQSATRGHVPLPHVSLEVKQIKDLASARGIPVTVLGDNHATVASVSEALPAASIVHFALHGQQKVDGPMESSLLLDDGAILTISQLAEMNLSNAELVFLSACETAMGCDKVSEEAIHIAAAMLFVGFRGAIATMWSISDEDGPEVARETYRYLLDVDMKAARALHESVQKLRARGDVPAIRWAPFVHLGA
ncbi:hypothetical protein BDZ89DRAFT_987424 [Hymenopellis radicata]|nr:hypothetical protein BDZ89DRAFT_987424 [Hymenopellis radicata]